MPERRRKAELRTQRSTTSAYDVFLGGSCNPTTWRQDTAIPHFKSQGITFYNPQQGNQSHQITTNHPPNQPATSPIMTQLVAANWVPEMIELEHQAKVTSHILFYVVNEQTRNVASMIEVCQFAGNNRRLVVVLNPYPGPDHAINGEQLSKVTGYTSLLTVSESLQAVLVEPEAAGTEVCRGSPPRPPSRHDVSWQQFSQTSVSTAVSVVQYSATRQDLGPVARVCLISFADYP